MEGTLEEATGKEPTQEAVAANLKDTLIPNGVNGKYDIDSDELSEANKDSTESRMESFGKTQDSEVEEMDQDGDIEFSEINCAEKDDTESLDGVTEVTKDQEDMEVDQHSNTSEVECLDEGQSEMEDPFIDQKSEDVETKNPKWQGSPKAPTDSGSVEALNESIEILSNSSPLKVVEENGSCESPEIEEISSSADSKETTPKKKARKQLDLSNITPRRSSRNIKRTSYIEKEVDEEEEHHRQPRGRSNDDEDEDCSDIEEIKPEDPLAVVDNKDKENSKLKSPKNNKTTIVVNDTKRLVEIAAGSKGSPKGGKKEPTLVIIDTNSILSGRGGVPVSSSSGSSSGDKSQQTLSSGAFSVVAMGGGQSIYPNMRTTTITPVPMSSKTAQLSPKATSITPVVNTPPAPILPTLTDDMFVVEAPSFIVPYVYEKPPIKPLREFVDKLEKSILEREREEEAAQEGEGDAEQGRSEQATPEPKIETEKRDDRAKSGSYFDQPLGKFFMQIGVNLVQEYVQTDLLRTQKRKQGKGSTSAETQHAINSLIKNLEFSKENNEPFHLEMKKCEFCSFKTESALVMQHHLETPHMRNYVYKCNFCTLEVRSPHDILFHMEAEHNTRGRLERGPAFHQCPNCPFEDNQKGKLTRHVIACTKKFRPERNLEPASDWEPPAKIPRLNRPRPIGPANTGALAMAMGAKGPQPLLPKLLPAPVPGRGRGRPPMQPRFTDMKTMRPGVTGMRQDNVAGMMYRPTSSGLLVPTSYQFGGNQMFQMVGGSGTVSSATIANTAASSKNPTAKLLSQPSISITPLPRTTSQTPIPGSGSSPKPGGKNTFVICEICDGYIKDLEQLRNHMQWIHKVKIHPKMIYNRPPLNCQKCQFRFFTDQGLERHLLGSHGLVTSSMQEAANKGKDAGRCPACGRVYQWKLLNHVARDHGMTLKPAHLSYKCTVCTATFGMYKQFENHVYSAHSVVAKRVMDKKSAPSSPSSRSNDSLLKPLKINDEITIIPQPAKPTTRSGGSSSRSGK